ncbi:hypothetical protein [Paenibacillus sp. FSL W8-0194]|uniref:hypothetical protein n=1 Tax=Paenibacillus sp. FSL W8-0194 TaxID=2921711 RepID=UPI0030DA73B8
MKTDRYEDNPASLFCGAGFLNFGPFKNLEVNDDAQDLIRRISPKLIAAGIDKPLLHRCGVSGLSSGVKGLASCAIYDLPIVPVLRPDGPWLGKQEQS